jgi:hypothetical protein
MRISLVLEDVGAGPQIIFSSSEPADARDFYKAHDGAGRVFLVINPMEEAFKFNKPKETPKPATRRKAETLI